MLRELEDVKVVGISGVPSAGSGKDTIAGMICRYQDSVDKPRQSMAFAARLRETMQALTHNLVLAENSWSAEGKATLVPTRAFGDTIGQLTQRLKHAFAWTLEFDRPCGWRCRFRKCLGFEPCHAKAADTMVLTRAAFALANPLTQTTTRSGGQGQGQCQCHPYWKEQLMIRYIPPIVMTFLYCCALLVLTRQQGSGWLDLVLGFFIVAAAVLIKATIRDTRIQVPENMTVGRLLQVLGTDIARRHLDEEIWVRALDHDWKRRGCPRIIVTDVRFPNEVAWVKSLSEVSRLLLLDARHRLRQKQQACGSGIGKYDKTMKDGRSRNHVSETGLNNIGVSTFDYILNNNGTLDLLNDQLDTAATATTLLGRR